MNIAFLITSGLKTDVEDDIFSSGIGSGFGDLGKSPPRVPRSFPVCCVPLPAVSAVLDIICVDDVDEGFFFKQPNWSQITSTFFCLFTFLCLFVYCFVCHKLYKAKKSNY